MNVLDFVSRLNLKVLTETDLEKPVKGCYIGDLLSWVMGRAQPGDMWITIMNNINIVAVASLTDCACILLCEGVNVEKSIIDKANSQDIIILQSDKTAYELALLISEEL